MSQIIELSEDDWGTTYNVTLYTSDDSTVAENLSSASSVSLDITRCDETPIVNDATVTVYDASGGVVQFTPEATWFTSTILGNRNYYVAIFKIVYASGVKHSFKIPVYVHRS
jgi:hypothetical protein